jgi:hypothetical protein
MKVRCGQLCAIFLTFTAYRLDGQLKLARNAAADWYYEREQNAKAVIIKTITANQHK